MRENTAPISCRIVFCINQKTNAMRTRQPPSRETRDVPVGAARTRSHSGDSTAAPMENKLVMPNVRRFSAYPMSCKGTVVSCCSLVGCIGGAFLLPSEQVTSLDEETALYAPGVAVSRTRSRWYCCIQYRFNDVDDR